MYHHHYNISSQDIYNDLYNLLYVYEDYPKINDIFYIIRNDNNSDNYYRNYYLVNDIIDDTIKCSAIRLHTEYNQPLHWLYYTEIYYKKIFGFKVKKYYIIKPTKQSHIGLGGY